VHLTALVEGSEHVCCRYRILAFRPLLEQAGHTLEVLPLPRRWWSRLWLLRSLLGANVILQRRLLPSWEITVLRRTVNRLFFDFDDAVFLRDSYSPKGLHHAGRLRRFSATVRVCDAVIAGNPFLAEQARRWCSRRYIHVIPTCVDPARYHPHSDRRDKPGGSLPSSARRPLQLVWVGSSSTLKGLEAVLPLLEEIGRQVPNVQLKLICDRFLHLQHMPVVECPWSEAGEAKALAAGDVGISWIPDDLWSRGKCGLKVLQYMAAGLPVVANRVGVHPEMIHQGETGYLANTPRQWIDAIARLAWDAQLRQRMGQQGRQRLEAGYSVAAGAARWVKVLETLSRPKVATLAA